ncbi:MAG: hypothetical protein HS100_18830 [Anaerolineales bacterium]|nr:hypothetical protein [Anaerolineales bacterium]
MKKTYIVILFLVSSCTLNLTSKNVITDSNCTPPCWKGIVPGETSKERLLEILSELPNVNQGEIGVTGPWDGYDDGVIFNVSSDSSLSKSQSVYIETRIISDNVVVINFTGDIDITLGEMINKTDEPELVMIQANPFGGLWISGVLPTKGISFGYATIELQESSQLEIKPETDLKWVTYFSPSLYHELLERGWFSMGNIDLPIVDIQYNWAGYGDIEERYFSQK